MQMFNMLREGINKIMFVTLLSSSTAEGLLFFSRKNNILNGDVKVFTALLEDNDKNMSEGEKICLRAGGKK